MLSTNPSAGVLGLLAAVVSVAQAGGVTSPPDEIPDSGLLVNSGIGNAALATARTTTRDVGDRLFRLRAGIRPGEETLQTQAAPAYSAKGGMSKSPITATTNRLRSWEVYGSLFYYTEEQDAQSLFGPNIPGNIAGVRLIHPSTDVDIFGGNLGIERHFAENWTVGLALGASKTDVDMALAGGSDIDSFSITPYLSYYQADALGRADFWADIMYSHGFHDFDIQRFTPGGIASGSPDADTDQLELTVGLNYGSGSITHGPYAGLRWIDGSIDSYVEVGPGAGFFPNQDIESLASILGYQMSFPIRRANGTLVPQVRAAWEHEFEDDANNLFGFGLGERDEDTAVLGAGVGYYFDSGWNAVLDYEGRLSSNVEGHYISLKVGKEF